MGLDVILYRVLKNHVCNNRECVGERKIFANGKIYSKIPNTLDDTVVSYVKYKCNCDNVFRPNIGVISWSDKVYFGQLFDVEIVASFRYGPYISFDTKLLKDMSDCSGTYSGSKLQELQCFLKNIENPSDKIAMYINLLKNITTDFLYIIKHC